MGNERSSAAGSSTASSWTPDRSRPRTTLLEALGDDEPSALLLTHIHFDHAGASGALVRRWPDLPVYVHERGAPHMAAPERLVASAARLYGGEEGLARLWGEVVPVPERNLHVLWAARPCSAPSASSTRRARLAPRQLPARAERHRVRRRRGRRPDPAVRLRDGADAAARHRRRGLGPLARPRRGLGPAGAGADPLRPRRRRRRPPRGDARAAARGRRRSRPGTASTRSWPASSSASSATPATSPTATPRRRRRTTSTSAPRRYLDKRAAA